MKPRSKCDKVLDICARGAARLAAYDHKAARKAMDRCLRRYETCRERRLTSGSFAGLGLPDADHHTLAKNLLRDALLAAHGAKGAIRDGRCREAFQALTTAQKLGYAGVEHARASGYRPTKNEAKDRFRLVQDVARSFERRCVREHGWMGGRSR